jgi:preprotein translocase subunit SecE
MADESAKKAPQAAAVGDYTRYVQFMYLAGIGIAAWLLNKIIDTTWAAVGEPVTPIVLASSIILSIGAALFLWRHNRVRQLAYEVVTELSKVTWPTKKELYAAVVAVIIVSVIVSIILFLFDAFWSWATTHIYAL